MNLAHLLVIKKMFSVYGAMKLTSPTKYQIE